VDAAWHVPNTAIPRVFQTSVVKEEIRRYSSQYSSHLNAHRNDNSESHGTIRQQQAIGKTPAKWSANHIPNVIVVFVVLFCKFHSQKPQEALNLLVTEDCYWALFYTPLQMFSHNLLNVLVQIANKMGLQKMVYLKHKEKVYRMRTCLGQFLFEPLVPPISM
jgi:hypothetical protein